MQTRRGRVGAQLGEARFRELPELLEVGACGKTLVQWTPSFIAPGVRVSRA
jgi:hypothetical protein